MSRLRKWLYDFDLILGTARVVKMNTPVKPQCLLKHPGCRLAAGRNAPSRIVGRTRNIASTGKSIEGIDLIKKDYRVNLLVSMIFDKYVPSEVEFAYQVTTVLSLAILSKFYGLPITND